MDIDYGPLTGLIGTFKGDKGLDIAPDPEGTEKNAYYETIVFTPAGDVTNAEEQTLVALHYHQVVSRKSNNEVFHDQTGYWMWDQSKDEIFQSIAIPRVVCVLAQGEAKTEENGDTVINVSTDVNGVLQSPFMHKKAKTTSFKQTFIIKGNELHYHETTMVDIYGNSFEHTDTNTLTKV